MQVVLGIQVKKGNLLFFHELVLVGTLSLCHSMTDMQTVNNHDENLKIS